MEISVSAVENLVTAYKGFQDELLSLYDGDAVSAVKYIADIFNGLMAIPNMIALFALSGIVAKETKNFFEEGKHKQK